MKSPLSFKGRIGEFFRKLEPRYQAKQMANSYEKVFRSGGASEGDRDRVLADLAQKAGWGRIQHPTGRYNELYELGLAHGKQEVFAHLFNQLRLSPKEIASLEATVRADRLKINELNHPDLNSQYI